MGLPQGELAEYLETDRLALRTRRDEVRDLACQVVEDVKPAARVP